MPTDSECELFTPEVFERGEYYWGGSCYGDPTPARRSFLAALADKPAPRFYNHLVNGNRQCCCTDGLSDEQSEIVDSVYPHAVRFSQSVLSLVLRAS